MKVTPKIDSGGNYSLPRVNDAAFGKRRCAGTSLGRMVGATRIELVTPTMSTRHARRKS